MRNCAYPGCQESVLHAKGLCRKHYQQQWWAALPPGSRKANPHAPKINCSHPACQATEWVKGLCRKHYHQQWRAAHLHASRDAVRRHREKGDNRKLLNAKSASRMRAARAADPERHRAAQREWLAANPDKAKLYSERRSRRNMTPEQLDRRKASEAKYKQANADKYRIYLREYAKRRRKSDPLFRIAETLRGGLGHALRRHLQGKPHKHSGVRDLGCSVAEFKAYIEQRFLPGMSWNNWRLDGWHLDHIKPLNAFDLTIPAQYLEACHYTNYQPLWAIDNLRKHTSIPGDSSCGSYYSQSMSAAP